ncbi:E3 ubiquitin ligase complex SCF subunit sconC-like [Neltuma alba]|uniref:E3 ubiquitin ligase complex SCF subunit sconC-like n=1 Tax=Neltuma alba TaxID=207710 RepID=UPI0010A3E9E9|nr:E3 ubiquitin ligase complex SCF subunit sconC-like [Prosopis alba]
MDLTVSMRVVHRDEIPLIRKRWLSLVPSSLKIVTLISSCGDEIGIAISAEEASKLAADVGVSGGEEVRLYNKVNTTTLSKVIRYCRRLDRPEAGVDVGLLFNMLLAAHNPEVAGMLESSCETVAHRMKGQTPD